jgi:antitoxin MazE
MRIRIRKWGNSLALRIPAPFAAETGIESDAEVDLSLEEGRLVVTPRVVRPYALDDLLAGVTKRNMHGAVDTGRPRGGEVW